ncbi:MAG: methyltransferase domain-containing protein [Mycolicibacterium sp.]|uniref:class I SAM-dependent methyltransferase n=1 Tax=Mycolicibacterium sp. TaxID=2320850 RepID=UPI003D10CEA5
MNTSEDLKSCCAQLYSSDVVALVLGESYHPGGAALTRRLADLLGLRTGQRVLDVATGPGATARLLVTEYGVTVDGVDLAETTLRQARYRADRDGMGASIRFHYGDAEALPLPDNTFDAVVSECSFCVFPDKDTAAAEFARVLRPGGRLGLADVTLTDDGLPDELNTVAARVACIADARPISDYAEILARAGLDTGRTEPHDAALLRMIDQIEARVHLARMTHAPILEQSGVDIDAVLRYTDLARSAVTDGRLGYALLIAEKR